ncbi:acyl-CoA dehydrogenase [Streptomyces sp. NPDC047022]|uniref:acyl-CoA dehydrogenase n=1 Tax=Streptomyces sp. NPDC047022 TaxID=3155737 RepID=UPI0033FCF9BA
MSGAAPGEEVPAEPEDFWQRVAREVADDLAVDAVDRDRAGKPPYGEVARLRESGLPSVLTPPCASGRGTGWRNAGAIVRRIAAADTSVGELLARHYALSWTARFYATPEHAEALEARAVRENWLWSGAIGSPDVSGQLPRGTEDALTLTPTADGYRLRGQRDLASAVTVADRFVLDAECVPTNECMVVLVDPGLPGISRDLWQDRFGQRLAGAGTVHFDDVTLGADAVLGTTTPDEDVIAPHAALAPLALRLMLAHAALGAAQGALAEARDLSRALAHQRQSNDAVLTGAGGLPPVPGGDADLLLALGESALATHTAASVLHRATDAMERAVAAGRKLSPDQCADTTAHVAAAEAVTVREAPRVCERVLELSLPDAEGLDRFWRNVRALAGHRPAGPMLRAVGEHFLSTGRVPSAPWN